ncbi:MAG: hypothetical protein QXI50_03785 [Candidatus Caldarchaeum sp.]
MSTIKYGAGFIVGGLLFMFMQPVLASIAVVTLIGLVIIFVVAMLIPGGWLLFFGVRSFMGLLRGIIAPVIAIMLAALISLAIASSSPLAASVFSFIVGGVAGVYVVNRLLWRSNPRPRASLLSRPVTQTGVRETRKLSKNVPKGPIAVVKTGRGWLFGGGEAGLPVSALRSGVIVLGEESIIAARTVIWSAVKAGLRIVSIGSPYMAAAVERAKLIRFGKISMNILKPPSSDRLAVRRWAENIAVPLAVAAGLDTAEAGMLIRFFEKFGGAQMKPDDVDKLVAEYGPTGSARLKDALGMVSSLFGEGNPEPEKLFSGNWQQLVIDLGHLSPSSQLFIGMYLLYESANLFPGCVVVFDSAELGLPELQILPYDARHVWLRTIKAVERMRGTGFVMVSSTGLLAPELMDLADTYIVTRGPSHVRRVLAERVGLEVNPAEMPVGHALVYTRAIAGKGPAVFEGELLSVPVADLEALGKEAERDAQLLREHLLAAFRDTLLYAELGDLAETGYRVLKAVKRLQTPTDDAVESYAGEGAKRVLALLLEKGYAVRDPAGVLGLTSLGEHAIKDWESRTEKHVSGEQEQQPPQPSAGLQTGLSAFSRQVTEKTKDGDFSESMRLVERARMRLLRGDSVTAVGIAYKAAVSALKALTGVEKGHLPDLAEKAAEKGLVKISEEEARRLYAANIEAKRLSKQAADGQPVSEEDRKRMADAAELLISLAERVIAFSESIAEGAGEESRQHVDSGVEESG